MRKGRSAEVEPERKLGLGLGFFQGHLVLGCEIGGPRLSFPIRSGRKVLVFGPAYLDRVVRVDRPLLDRNLGGPLDLSVEGRLEPGSAGLRLVDPLGGTLELGLPDDWPGPTGDVRLARALLPQHGDWTRALRVLSWQDDLGGMGAGYAAALGGELTSALGSHDDPTSQAIGHRLEEAGVRHRPIRVPDRSADWTLLLSSGPHGDKLPVGFRGCHAAITSLGDLADEPSALRVVASFPNRLAAEALRGAGAGMRFFAPAIRNMLDRDPPLAEFAGSIDVLCCNKHEWSSLPERGAVAAVIPLVAVTRGEQGSTILFRQPNGGAGSLVVAAFPRTDPPRDTNRAGEAFAATLVSGLLDAGWTPGPIERDLLALLAQRASAAAALELDLTGFGFPSRAEVDRALQQGGVYGDDLQAPR